MSILDRIIEIIAILGELTLACLPVFIVLLLLEKLGDKANEKFEAIDWQGFWDRKIAAAQAREQAAWDKRARKIDEREARDKNSGGNT